MDRYDSSSIPAAHAASYLRSLKGMLRPMSPLPTETEPQLTPALPIEAVLFDIYGTLMISEAGDIGLTSLDEGQEGLDFTLSGDEEERSFAYDELRTLLTEIIREEHSRIRKENPGLQYPEVDIISLWDAIFRREMKDGFTAAQLCEAALRFEMTGNRVDLMPGTLDLLDGLRERAIPLGIVSNAQFYTPLLLEYLTGRSLEGMGFDPDCLSWSYLCGCGKPEPKIFDGPLRALKDRGIVTERILYVGNDMLNDIATAASKGLKTALFAGDRRSLRMREGDERIRGVRPDYIITELNQLMEIMPGGFDGR